MSAFRIVQYIHELSNRVPIRAMMGYLYYADLCLLLAIITDIAKFFVNGIACLIVPSIIIKYISLTLFIIIWAFARKVSIIDLLSVCLLRHSGQFWVVFIFQLTPLFFIVLSILFMVHQFGLAVSIINSFLIDGLMVAYIISQFVILKNGDRFIDMAIIARKDWSALYAEFKHKNDC